MLPLGMPDERHYCEHCGKEISNPVWLELSSKTGKWYNSGLCPNDESQGCFPVGSECAKKLLKE